MGHGARPSSFLPHSFPPLSPSLIPFHPPFPPQELGTKSRPFDYIPSCIPRYPLLTPFYPFFGFSPLPLPLPPQELGTKSRPFANIAGVCRRCSEQIAWRRKYGKYKPLTEPAKCGACGKRSVKDAYHAICKACAKEKGLCAKCRQPTKEIVQDGAAVRENEMKQLEEALGRLRERERRSLLRAMEKGNAGAANSVAKKAAKKAAKGDDSEEDEDDDEEDEWEEDEGEDEGEKDENEGEKDEEGEEDGEDGDGDGGEAGEGKEDEADDSKGGSKGGGTADGTETKKDDYT
ncbi:unnamed protein product [Closterium sp. Naga37s-1]|nr:unnamed protein product [Closterium sp. Naga37s-1]